VAASCGIDALPCPVVVLSVYRQTCSGNNYMVSGESLKNGLVNTLLMVPDISLTNQLAGHVTGCKTHKTG